MSASGMNLYVHSWRNAGVSFPQPGLIVASMAWISSTSSFAVGIGMWAKVPRSMR